MYVDANSCAHNPGAVVTRSHGMEEIYNDARASRAFEICSFP
jgi:hypothetical protein